MFPIPAWQRVTVLMQSQALRTKSRVTGRQVWCVLCPGLWTRCAQKAMLQVRVKTYHYNYWEMNSLEDLLGENT